MIKLDEYSDKCGTISILKELEIIIQTNNNLEKIILDKLSPYDYNIDIKKSIDNNHLKEINVSFESKNTSYEIMSYLNKKHIITELNFKFLFNTFNEEKSNQIKNLKLNNLIMNIDNIEIKDCGIMYINLIGHMVD